MTDRTDVHTVIPQPRPLATAAVLCLLAGAMFFSNLGAHDLWGPDEVRYALVAREMRETGEYALPHLNGGVYLEKPPLMFWATNLFAAAHAKMVPHPAGGGAAAGVGYYVNEVTARLPSAFAALGTLLLLWHLAARRWDAWTGFAAAVILATNVQFAWFARSGSLDTLLTLCVTGAIVCGVRALDAERYWPPWVLGVGLGLAGGLLTKGPVALLLVLVILGPYGWSIGRGGRAAAVLLGALAVACAIVLPWWRAAYERSGGAYGNLSELARQTGGRAVESYSHQKPVYHYALGIFGEFLPWSLFLPAALWSAFRARGTLEWPRLRLACCWVVVPFLVFTAMSGKRGQYLLPIYPGLALLVAVYLRQYAGDLRSLSRVRPILWPTLLMAGAMVAVGVVALLAGALLPGALDADGRWSAWIGTVRPADLARAHAVLLPIAGSGMALACLGMWAVLHHVHRPPSRVIATIAACMLLVFGFVAGAALPAMDTVKSARGFASAVRGLAGFETEVVLYSSFRPDIAYYYGRKLTVKQPQAILRTADEARPVLAIMRQKHYDQLRERIPPQYVVLHREQIGSRVWLILSNRPPTI